MAIHTQKRESVTLALLETITSDLKQAMRDKNKLKTSVLRMVLSEFKYAMTSENAKAEELEDKEALKILMGYHKRLEKSLKDYPEGDKKQLIESELAILIPYMPEKMSADDLSKVVDDTLAKQDETNFGVLMKYILAEHGSQVDPGQLSRLLKERLKG